MKKLVAFFLSILCIFLFIGCSNSKWEEYFEIAYQGYEYNEPSYKKYDITNTTNRALSDVRAIIKAKNWMGKTVQFEKTVASKIEPRETVVFKIFSRDIKEEFEKQNLLTDISESEIIEIK